MCPQFQGCLLETCSTPGHALIYRIRNWGVGAVGSSLLAGFGLRMPGPGNTVHAATWLLLLGGGDLYYIRGKLEKEIKWPVKGHRVS